jgi:POT family proton-dependent oligopeptide transporter
MRADVHAEEGYWPVLLALISMAAPRKVNSTLMGASFPSLFVGSVIMGWVGSFYDRMSPAAFWTLDASIGLAGAILVLLFGPALKRALEPHESERLRPAAMPQEVEV